LRFVGDTFFFRTLSAAEVKGPITEPRILKAAEGADEFLNTAVRFMEGDENASGDQRVFADNLRLDCSEQVLVVLSGCITLRRLSAART
jgi:hypothetical protein